MNRKFLWAILFFSVGGIITSWLATQQYLQILQHGLEHTSFCTINNFVNCDLAYASSHAIFLGIPVAWLGLLFFVWSGALSFWLLRQREPSTSLASFGWLSSLAALLYSAYKAYISFGVLDVACILCLSMDVAVLGIFLCWHLYLKLGLNPFSKLNFKNAAGLIAGLTLVVFGLGWLVIGAIQDKKFTEGKLDVPVSKVLQYHFRQGEYAFTPDSKNPVWGNPNAKVTIVEFSDFECPFCKRAAFHLKPYLAEFQKDVRLYFYQYPLDQSCNRHMTNPGHKNACLAAHASLCAQRQGKFWEYHDEVFRHQKEISKEKLLQLAQQIGLPLLEFEKCLEDNSVRMQIEENIEAGQKIYLEGTPTVLINNRRVKYWFYPEVLRAIIREELKKAR